MNPFFRFFIAALLLSAVIGGGTLGYYLIEGDQPGGDKWTFRSDRGLWRGAQAF